MSEKCFYKAGRRTENKLMKTKNSDSKKIKIPSCKINHQNFIESFFLQSQLLTITFPGDFFFLNVSVKERESNGQ